MNKEIKEVEEIIDEIEDKFQLDILTNKDVKEHFIKLLFHDLPNECGRELDTLIKFVNLKKKYPEYDLYLLEYLDGYNQIKNIKKKWIAVLGHAMTPREVFAADELEDIENHLEKSQTTTQNQLMHLYECGQLVQFKLKITF